jgi:hypothetical protein
MLLYCLVLAPLLTGCIMFPISHRRTPVAPEKDFSFVRVGSTSRAEVTDRCGRFTKEFDGGRVAYYELAETGEKMLWVMFPFIPIGTRNTGGGREAALFRFDERDTVRRFKIVDENSDWHLEQRALKWSHER